MRLRILTGGVALALMMPLSQSDELTAQDVRLGEADAVFPEAFSFIQTVRELADGRLIVADPLAQDLAVVDMDAGTMQTLGRAGQGPGEYRQPDAVWPMPGGATLVVDLGNGRLMTLGPDLRFEDGTKPIALTEPRRGSELVLAMPSGVDSEGHVYTRGMGMRMGGGAALPDSSAILRLDLETKGVDTVSMVKLPGRTTSTSGGRDEQRREIRQIPYSGQDSWGVAEDGWVAVARLSDYHLEWIAPDGSVTVGSPVGYDPIRIRRAEREEWGQELSRAGGGIGMGMTVDNGAVQMSFNRGGMEDGDGPDLDSYEWPESKPPFYNGAIQIDSDGRAWVQRHVPAGEPATFDVFDRTASRMGTVLMPDGRSLLGFGDGTLYAVYYDEFDLMYLERYVMPWT